MLRSAESHVPKLIAVKLFLPNYNACDHNPPTLQSDRQTYRQLIMVIPRYATLRTVKVVVCFLHTDDEFYAIVSNDYGDYTHCLRSRSRPRLRAIKVIQCKLA